VADTPNEEFDLTIDCQVESGHWATLDSLQQKAETALAATMEVLDFPLPKESEVSIVFCNDAKIKELNGQWREQDKPTNVLSFATNDGVARESWSPLLGDIILANETLAREALEQEKPFDAHLTHLMVHGFLHLLGFDHETSEEAEVMEKTEINALSKLGIADPYSEQ